MEYICRRLASRDIDLVEDMNQGFRDGFVRRENALAFLENPANWLYAAVSEGIIIGFAYGYELNRLNGDGNMLYIHEVGVMDGYQRQGVGYRLMTELIAECRAKGMCKCFLSAYQNNAGANALYKKLGGRVSDESMGKDVSYYFPLK